MINPNRVWRLPRWEITIWFTLQSVRCIRGTIREAKTKIPIQSIRTAIVIPVVLLTFVLAGCGSGNSTASNGEGGSGGQTPPGIPTLSANAPSSAVAGGSALTLTLFGSNFENGASVKWNGTALTASWVGATNMTAV